MQNGSLIRRERQHSPDVWEFRWREPGPDGVRRHRRIVLGSAVEIGQQSAARRAVAALRLEINIDDVRFRQSTVHAHRAVEAISEGSVFFGIGPVRNRPGGRISWNADGTGTSSGRVRPTCRIAEHRKVKFREHIPSLAVPNSCLDDSWPCNRNRANAYWRNCRGSGACAGSDRALPLTKKRGKQSCSVSSRPGRPTNY